MNFSQFDPTRSYYRDSTVVELRNSGEDPETSFLDYIRYGTVGALTSAAVGIYNTGVALGEVIGVADSDSYIDEHDSINFLWGESAADFYSRHKTGVDAAGLIGGSFVPGLGAIRALRAAQRAGVIFRPMQVSTGVRNADLVLGSKSVEAAKNSVLNGGTMGLRNPEVRQAFKVGAQQQFMEAAAFDLSLVLLQNQNAALNPDDLGYFEAAKQTFVESVPFTFLGGAVGTGVDALRIRGSIKSYVADQWQKTGNLINPKIGELRGMELGDKLLHIANQAEAHAALRKSINAMPAGPEQDFALKQFERGRNIIQQEITNSLLAANVKDPEIVSALEGLMEVAGEGNISEVANIISALSKVERLTPDNLTEFNNFYTKTRAPLAVLEGDTGADLAEQLMQRQQALSNALREQGLEDFADEVFAASAQQVTMSSANSLGGAWTSTRLANHPSFNSIQQGNVTLYNKFTADGTQLFLPDVAFINRGNIEGFYELAKTYNTDLGRKFDMSLEDFTRYTVLHELGHIKTNEVATLNVISNALSSDFSEATGVVKDLIRASLRSRGVSWENAHAAARRKMSDDEMAEAILQTYRDASLTEILDVRDFKYLISPRELLADGHAYMTHEATRIRASKEFPSLAKFFNEQGALAKAWDDTNTIYNVRTGQTYTSFLPGIQDVSVKPSYNPGKDVLTVPELGRSFKRDDTAFSGLAGKARKSDFDYLNYDAQWNMYSRIDPVQLFKNSVTKSGALNIAEDNLPAMERFVVFAKENEGFRVEAFDAGLVRYNGEVVSLNKLERMLTQRKSEMQLELATLPADVRPNEHHIAKILNMDVERAMGFSEGELLLYGQKDFTRPELLKFAYKYEQPSNYEQSSIHLSATMARLEMLKEQRERVSALLLGDTFDLLEDIPTELLASVSPTDTRAGMLTALRTQFGSLREKAQYIGKIVNNARSKKIQEVNDSYRGHSNFFNRRENQGARYELAQIDNLVRRHWYYHATFNMDDGRQVQAIVSKQELGNYLKSLESAGEEIPITREVLESLTESDFNALSAAKLAGDDPAVVQLSKNVGDFYSQHVNTNYNAVQKMRELGAVRGKEPVLDDLVIYPPPRDLQSTPYHGFVVPNQFVAGSDGRNFMVFAESAQEFNNKKAAILKRYGSQYKVVTQEQISEYKKLRGDYEQGLVFDSIFFDSSLARTGTASEILPNIDVTASATLERYRNWTINMETALLRSGVELKYDDVVAGLKQIDREMDAVERGNLLGRKKSAEPETIWKDSLAVMLDQKSYSGPLENLFVRVNDYIGEAGSKVIDGALSVFRTPASGRITQEMLDEFNTTLANAGYVSPMDDVVEALLVSPNTVKSNTLPQLVRTMSNLVSTLMLRMDFAHSYIQMVSTPILALPVLQEAKQALRGTAKGQQLEAMTGVINPSNNVYEPSAAKLLKDGTTAFFTDEGREFISQMRDRNIITDYMIQYLDTLDFRTFTGAHTLQHASTKIDNLAKFASRFSGFKFTEEFTRFQVAWAAKRIGEVRGIPLDEMWATISSSVDKVHGVYLGNQRAQLFQGVLGQSVGLFQTYFFNFVQNMAKFIESGNARSAATMAAMQTSMFGIQSWPGFHQLNQMIGETNRDNHDLYSLTGADDPRSNSVYAFYGLASHALGFPVDFYTRGDLALRHPTVVPTSPYEFPVFSTISKAVGNLYNTAKLVFDEDTPTSQALIHGIAHNGMNRPMQGIGNIIRGRITSNSGQVNFDNSNYVDYDTANEMNWGAMFARVIGTRPLNESIIMNSYYRQRSYDANLRRNTIELSKKIQMNLATGSIDHQTYGDFAESYERSGGDIQNFNSYFMRQLRQAERPVMQEFYEEMQKDSTLSRARSRIESRQNLSPIWSNDIARFVSDREAD